MDIKLRAVIDGSDGCTDYQLGKPGYSARHRQEDNWFGRRSHA
jgi:hypothetical protein